LSDSGKITKIVFGNCILSLLLPEKLNFHKTEMVFKMGGCFMPYPVNSNWYALLPVTHSIACTVLYAVANIYLYLSNDNKIMISACFIISLKDRWHNFAVNSPNTQTKTVWCLHRTMIV
jgi:hypothetical protein